VSGAETGLSTRLAALRARVEAAAARAGRPAQEIALVGVSKRKSSALVIEAVRCGVAHIGENYVQEAIPKIAEVEEKLKSSGTRAPRWHFIGQLQRNKARLVAEHFDLVETVDREALGSELDRRAGQVGRRLGILLQVNLSEEPQKGGVEADALPALLAASRGWRHLDVVGLMTVPAASRDPEASRSSFARLRTLRDALRGDAGGSELRELSMGMSADFEVAIEEGATIIRLGTALFGARDA